MLASLKIFLNLIFLTWIYLEPTACPLSIEISMFLASSIKELQVVSI